MIGFQGNLIVLLFAAFIGAKRLLAMRRPEQLAAHSAFALAVIMLSTLRFPFSLFLILPCLITALVGAEYLPVACRGKLLAAMGANLRGDRHAAVCRNLRRLALLPIRLFSGPLTG